MKTLTFFVWLSLLALPLLPAYAFMLMITAHRTPPPHVHAPEVDSSTLSFDTDVFDQKGNSIGVVGQGGQILARAAGETGVLTARWQDEQGADHACSLPFAPLSDKNTKAQKTAYDEVQVVCKPMVTTHTPTEKTSS